MMRFNKLKNCFVVADISANHGQDFNRAVALIKEAKRCGADAVKFQTYTPDTLTINMDNRYFRINHPKWGGQTLFQLYKKAYTPWDWFKLLKKTADRCGIMFFSTIFDYSSVDLMEELDIPIYKIASFELVDLPLIEYVAKTGRPIIMSTGMAKLNEIKDAVDTAKKAGAKEIVLLKCISNYPADPEDMNLRTIPHMKKMFTLPVGISDHTLGISVSLAAVSLGAVVVERHLTLSRKLSGPDSFFSLEPKELKELVDNTRIVEKALGEVRYGLTQSEKKSRIFRRSLFIVRDMKKGESFTHQNVRSIRPANGLAPKHLTRILGKKAIKDIRKGTPMSNAFIA